MALKTLMLRRDIELKKKSLAGLQAAREQLESRRAELEKSIGEVETDEQRDAVNAEIAAFETDDQENAAATVELEREIESLEHELAEAEAEQDTTPPEEPGENRGANPVNNERRIPMIRKFFGMTAEQIRSFLADEKVTSFLTEVRSAIREKRALSNVGLTIPETMLGLVREEIARQSRLLRFVAVRNVGGVARQNILGKIPEAVWTEMCGRINEMDLQFSQSEVDGYKVGAFVPVCNAVLEDSDLNLATEIVNAIATAIAKALDKAILFGTGTKMPIGIATRLAASSQPSWWGTHEPDFTDLHTSNVQTINVKSSSGAAFFMALVEKLAIAKPKYSAEGLFWVMNRKTHMDIMAKCLAFNSNAALVANPDLFPVVGGTVVEVEDDDLADYEIIGGFGGNYLLAERAGVQLESSKDYLFIEDQTVFKGTARYDGRPLCGEAFVIVNYNNTAPTTSKDFTPDEANSVEEIRLNTHTGAISGTGTLKLKAITNPGKGTVTWATGDSDVATVSSAGVVTGVSAGTTVITATCNGLTDNCTVTVS